jgi:GT2 family glycosyltransferase
MSAYNKFGEGLYQPKFFSLKEKLVIQSTGNMLHIFGFGFARDKGKIDNEKIKSIEKINYASGTCLFTSKIVLDKIGLLDPFLFLYHDDLDLGWRAAHIGINSFYVPKSIIYHAESYSIKWSSKKFYWLERNRKYCLLTHYSKETYAKMRLSLFLVDLCVWLFYLSKGFLGAKIKAELDIFRNRKFIKIRYNQLEKIKIVSDKELIKKFPDEIFVPKNVSEPIFNQLFNSILSALSKKVKKKII